MKKIILKIDKYKIIINKVRLIIMMILFLYCVFMVNLSFKLKTKYITKYNGFKYFFLNIVTLYIDVDLFEKCFSRTKV